MKNKRNLKNSLALVSLVLFLLVPGFGWAQSFVLSPTILPDFGNQCITTTSGQSFTITGTSLTTADVTVGALAGFSYSTAALGPFTSTLTLTQPGGAFSSTVYVNFSPTLVQSYNGNIVVSGGGAVSANCAATGSGVNTPPAVTTTTPATTITATTVTCSGNVTNAGCGSFTARGICYGTGANPDVLGIHSSEAGTTGVFSSSLTGLTPATTYHFRAYATSSVTTTYGADFTFTTLSLVPVVISLAPTTITNNSATFHGNVNANGGSTTVSFQYGLATLTYGALMTAAESPVTGSSPTAVSLAVTGLFPNTQYFFRAVGTNSGGPGYGNELTFTTLPLAPVVTSAAATTVTSNSATLNGTVNANGASTAVTFQYGLTTSYGTTITAIGSPVTGSSNMAVSLDINNLAPNTLYHFRAVGTNTGGTMNGGDLTFTTLPAPTVITTTSTPAQFSAIINGTVNANGFATDVTFQYGQTTAYGSAVSATPGTASGTSVTNVSAVISGLVPNTLYHFRAVGINSVGTSFGNDQTFTLLASGAAPTTQASNITFSAVTATGMTVSWTPGNGARRVVMMNTYLNFPDPITLNGTSPAANTIYTGGDPQVVYNGTGNSVTVTLSNASPIWYQFRVYEYNGTGSGASYCIASGASNPNSQLNATLSGIKRVGLLGDYHTLTIAAQAIRDNVISGPLQLILIDDTYPTETFPIRIDYNLGSSATNTITIKPDVGKHPVITGNTAGEIFLLYGCDYVAIDGSNQVGGTTKDLSIINNYPGPASGADPNYNCGINLLNNSSKSPTNCVIKNCIVTALPDLINSYGIATTAGYGNYNNISIVNNTITNARFGIEYVGLSGNKSNNGIISGNILGDAAHPLTQGGILMSNCDNMLISGNEIFGFAAGTPVQTQYGISVGTGSTNTRIIKNKIHDFYYSDVDAYACRGIIYNAEATSPTEISNNLIYNIKGRGARISTADQAFAENIPSGISVMSGGNLQIYNNSINLTGNVLGTSDLAFESGSACLLINSGVTNLDIRNNIFKNSMTGIVGSSVCKTYGIVSYSAANAIGVVNYNDYFIDGVNPVTGYLASDLVTLANWQAATAKDANAVSANPGFVSDNDLHPGQIGPNNSGIAISAITSDYANVTRSNPPDMGAYEYSLLATVTTGAATSLTSSGATLNGSVNANNESAAVTFEYGLTAGYGTTITIALPVTGSVLTPVSSTLTGLLPNNSYHFRINANTAAGIVHGNDQTFTTLAIPATVVTEIPTNVNGTSAQLNGTVNANNASTAVSFNFGLTTAYEYAPINATPSTITGSTVTTALANMSNLIPNTTYHYRIVGINTAGTSNGADQTFTTPCILPGAISGADRAICLNESTTLGAAAVTGNTYAWTSVPAGFTSALANPTVSPLSTTTYTVAETITATACTNSHSVVVTVNPLPLAAAGTDRAICLNESTTLGATAVTGNTYSWTSVPAGFTSLVANPAVAPLLTTTYTITETITATGCTNTHSVVVTVNPLPVAAAGADRAICLNESTTLGAAAVTGNTYSWTSVPAGFTSVAANPMVTPLLTTTYTVAETITATGCTNMHSVVVTVNPLPVPAITGPSSAAAGSTSNIYSTDAGMTGYIWTVSAGGTITAGAGTQSITVTWNTAGAQQVSVLYTSSLGCNPFTPAIYSITVNPVPNAPVITLSGYTLTSDAPQGNQWYMNGVLIPGATNASYLVLQTGSYTSIVTLNGVASGPSNIVNVIYVGISTVEAGQFGLYPNPSNGLFTASLTWPTTEMFTIRVYNNLGSLMFEQKDILVDGSARQLVDLSAAPNGIYTVSFTSGNSRVIRKIIINHQ